MAIVLKWTPQGVIYVCLLIATFSIPPSMAGNNSLTPSGTRCVCPGDKITYTCNILGGGTTLWSGTTLDCEPGGITLSHIPSLFQPGTFDYCDGDITSEIVGIKGDCYISRINFTAIAKFNGTSIDCSVQDPEIIPVGDSTIFIIPVSVYLQELSGFMVSSVNMTEITISWTGVNSLCSESISYYVTSNCSNVTCTTRRKEAACSNLPIASMCAFNIRSEVCRQIQTVNNAITVTLRRPEANITPVYSPGSPSTLIKVIITIYPEPFLSVAGDGPSPVVDYSFSYSNTNMNIPGCQESEVMCQRSLEFPCPPSPKIDVTLSAFSMLGQGPATDPRTIGCTNEFVRVEYDSATSTITCNFLDETDTSIKSCSLRQCDQMLASGNGQNSTVEAPNSIALNVATRDSDCFLVTASSNSFKITVEVGTSSVGTGNISTGAVIAIVICVIGAIIAVTTISVVVITVIMLKFKKKLTTERLVQGNVRDDEQQWKEPDLEEFRVLKLDEIKTIEQFQLQEIPKDDIKVIDIDRDYELKELTEEMESNFKVTVARSFYEFKGELEDIPKQKEIIFMEEKSSKLYTSTITSLKQNRSFRDVMTKLRKLLTGYKVFVESFESDVKCLEAGTTVLYEVQKTESNSEEVNTDHEGATRSSSKSGTETNNTEGAAETTHI